MPRYTFTVDLSGSGDNQEAAWSDAVDAFSADPGEPTTAQLDEDDEEPEGDAGRQPKPMTIEITPKGCETLEGRTRVRLATAAFENATANVANLASQFLDGWENVIRGRVGGDEPELTEELREVKEAIADRRAKEEEFVRAVAGAPKTSTEILRDAVGEHNAKIQPEPAVIPNRVRILWGATREPDQEPSEYEFGTTEELNAFLHGVDEAVGWLDHEQIDPNPDGSWPEPEPEVD